MSAVNNQPEIPTNQGNTSQSHIMDWYTEADWARMHEQPLRARLLLYAAIIMFALLIVWASVAEVDEIARGQGKVVPSSQLQVIQSLDGGVVEEIYVKEGQLVNAGDLLVRIDSTRFTSSLAENQAQIFALTLKAMRLEALTKDKPFVIPAELIMGDASIIAQETNLYNSTLSEIVAQTSISDQQIVQRQQELVEARAKLEQAQRSLDLTSQELSVTEPLVGSGAVSEVEILRLRRDVARLKGERNQTSAQISRIQSAIQEAERKKQEVRLSFSNKLSAELSDTLGKLSALNATSTGFADKVVKADLKSPVRGTVKRLLMNTVGGVIQPGKDIIEIVPTDDTLLLEAKIRPQDIAFLHPGQKAIVKLTAYDFTIYGSLEGEVEQIGADTVINEKEEAFYIVRVRTNSASLGDNLPIIPGMVAQVDIMTGKKTILAYLMKPILRAKANALSER
ncbi:MAG: HlyD family type I secretion periplasmic adaptor subunit [Thiotrichales bacterium]|nr:HlyD family type I secretion periplasmic adaptor subunit [Thiotrichales bacterium]